MAVNTTKFPARGTSSHSVTARKSSARGAGRNPSDDQILGLVTSVAPPPGGESYSDGEESGTAAVQPQDGAALADQASPVATGEGNSPASDAGVAKSAPVPTELAPILEANPQLRQAWDAAHEYQQVFATPAAARDAQQQLADLDGMFFSGRPADHAALAARIQELSPEAFHGLAQAMQAHATKVAVSGNPQQASVPTTAESQTAQAVSGHPVDGAGAASAAPSAAVPAVSAQRANDPRHAAQAPYELPIRSEQNQSELVRSGQAAFFHDTNAAAVEQILGAIHSQVDRLLPDSVAGGTRNRIVGEIYRELDATLRANRQLGKQLREAFQSGTGDSAHQRAIVTLVTGRARQALPAVAKRVIGEWTQSIVAANRERLGRHAAASKRVDISGAGPSDGVNRKPISPRDVNYRKLSDADILNL